MAGWTQCFYSQALTATITHPWLCTRGDGRGEAERLQEGTKLQIHETYCSIEGMGECTPLVFGNDEK